MRRVGGGEWTMATVSPVTEDDEVDEPRPFWKPWVFGGNINAGLGVLSVRMLRSESGRQNAGISKRPEAAGPVPLTCLLMERDGQGVKQAFLAGQVGTHAPRTISEHHPIHPGAATQQ